MSEVRRSRLVRQENRVVSPRDVEFRPALDPAVPADEPGALLVEGGLLLGRQELPIAELLRTLERRVDLGGPDALQIRLAPRCPD